MLNKTSYFLRNFFTYTVNNTSLAKREGSMLREPRHEFLLYFFNVTLSLVFLKEKYLKSMFFFKKISLWNGYYYYLCFGMFLFFLFSEAEYGEGTREPSIKMLRSY